MIAGLLALRTRAKSSPPSTVPRRLRGTLPARLAPALIFLVIAALLFAFMSAFSYPRLPHWYPGVKPAHYKGPRWLEAWVRFDAGWYRDIAEHGYYYAGDRAQSSVPFFPGYPLVMRGLHRLFGGNMVTLGIPVTFASGLVATTLLYRWCVARFSSSASLLACTALCLSPYAFFIFGTVYADALFLALALSAFSLQEADHPFLAGVAGAAAAVTRPVGAAVVIGLIAVLYERRTRQDHARPRRADWWILTALVGLAAYPIYLWSKFGNPFAFAVAEGAPGWDQKSGPRTWLKIEYFTRVVFIYRRGILYPMGLTLQLFVALALLLAVVKMRHRVGLGYTIYAACVLGIPLLASKDFQGVGRYSLAAFPAFGAVGEYLSRVRVSARVLVALAAAALLAVMSSAYARASYIA